MNMNKKELLLEGTVYIVILCQAFNQMCIQMSCGEPLFKENCHIFHMLLKKIIHLRGPIMHS